MTLGRGRPWRGGSGEVLWEDTRAELCVCDGEVQVLCKIAVREHRECSCVALEGSGTALHCGC